MSLESDLFKYFKADFELLEPYGFVLKDGSYFYTAPIKGGQLSAIIKVDSTGNISGRIIDSDIGDDYYLFRRNDGNAFASEVREEYLEILKQIAINCFKARPFMSDQGNMISDYVYQEYGDIPDYPFKDDGSAVIRNHNNRKWYVQIMALPEKKLKGDKDNVVEVINLKVDPKNLDTYLNMEDIFPAYHMNKKNWISVILDSSVSDEILTHLVDESYSFTDHYHSDTSSPSCWLVPANSARYDVLGAFRSRKVLHWHTRKKMRKGDTVYIYYAAPYSSIIIKATVTAVEQDNLTAMELVEIYDSKRYPLKTLKEHGLKTVRFIYRLPSSVVDYLENEDK